MFSAYPRRDFHHDGVGSLILGRVSKPDVKISVGLVSRMTVRALRPFQFLFQEKPRNLNGPHFFGLDRSQGLFRPLGSMLLTHTVRDLLLCKIVEMHRFEAVS